MWERERCDCLFCSIRRGEDWKAKLFWMAMLCLFVATGVGIVLALSFVL